MKNKHKSRRIGTYCLSFLIAGCLQINAQKVSFSEGTVSLKEAFQKIEASSKYKIAYNGTQLDVNKKVVLNQKNAEVLDVLSQVLAGTGYTYSVKGDYLVITSPSQNAVNQKVKNVKGVIVDETGEPVIGANVVVSGTTNGTVTDFNGNFSLEVPENGTLDVSFIGYLTQSISLKGKNDFRITLKEDTQKLDEVVVVGYGTRSRKSITGSVDQVNSEIFENRPVTNATQALQGASANLIIQSKNANPNDNSMNINIRGVSTMGNNDPLIVIDGLVSSSSTLNNLNPNDIDNVSVLKDAGSAAIYGSRSANGVILVTTKKGSKGSKPVVAFNGQVGIQDPHILFSPVEGWQNAMLRNQANMNVGSAPQFTPTQIRDLYDHRNEEEWLYDQIIKSGLQQNYNINVSGGSENTTYMVSASYYNQESNFQGSFGMERYNFRSNLSTEYGRFKLTSLMAYNRRKDRTVAGGTGNTIINSSRVPSYYYYKFMEGDKYLVNDIVGDDNPLALLQDGGYEKKDEDNFIGSMNLDVKIIDGLKATGLVGLDLTQHHRYRRDKKVPLYSSADLENPVLYMHSNTMTEDYNEKRYTLSTQFLLDFNRTFNNVHNVSALVGVSNESYTKQASRIAWEYTDEDLGLPTTDESIQNKDNKNSNNDTDQTSITSVFGRVGYNYMDKYYGDVSFRYDGSSKFAKDERWGFFPSFSAGWRINQESFMQDASWIDNLKLRASWGQLGNINNVGQYDYFSTYVQGGNYNFENTIVSGIREGKPANPGLGWETVTITNVGVDFDILNGLFSFTGEFYDKQTKDILLSYPSPAEVGINSDYKVSQNIGKVSNKGLEFNISHNKTIGDFSYTVGFNLSKNWNKVKDLGANDPMIEDPWIKKVGYAIGTFYGFRSDGLLTQEDIDNGNYITDGITPQAGDIKYVDLDGDGKLTDKDRDYLACDVPDITYGVNLNLRYKGFELSMFGQGVTGTMVRFYQEQAWAFSDNASPREFHLKRWTVDNPDPNAAYPRIYPRTSAHSTFNNKFSDFWLFDSDYFRIKNITFGYNFNKHQIQHLGVDALKLYVSAENPFTIRADHRMEDFDPETPSGRGTDTRGTSSISLGVNLTF